uniref:Transcription factor Adf-1 n=1 Tax=Lygus hesperus TaxID=30085 RepID=A0A146MHA7_LYGHE
METLISQVQKRSVLWNKADVHYRHKRKVNAAWEAVAAETGYPKEEARSKWKNIRDTFIRELKKVTPRTGDSSPGLYTGKWAYFEMMSFLIDTQNVILHPPSTDCDFSNDIPSQVSDSQHAEIPTVSQLPTSSSVKYEQFDGEESGDTTEDTNPAVTFPTTSSGVGRPPKKRIRTQDLTTVERQDNFDGISQSDEYDLDFFKSLMPYMRKLGDKQKLRVRNEIQNILLRELPDE